MPSSRATAFSDRSPLWLTVATLLLLAPFLNKPVHIDDTVYLWVADQIQADPLDFYGFEKNWDGRLEPVDEFNKNPPGISYFLALPDWIGGGRVWVLHLSMLLPACLAVLGVYRLARNLNTNPGIAAAVALVSPAFLVSATTLMADVLTLAFYVWAVALWVEALPAQAVRQVGHDEKPSWKLPCAATLISFAVLTKYVAVTAILLLAAYTLLQTTLAVRTRLAKLLWLFVPLAVLGLYDVYTAQRYGGGMFAEAATYSSAYSVEALTTGLDERGLTALSFLGAGYLPVLLLIPWLWRKRVAIAWAVVAIVIAILLAATGGFDDRYLLYDGADLRWGYVVQLALAITGGLHIAALAGVELSRRRDATSVLLALWIGGIYVFAAFLNWSVNIRALLPVAPAVAVLVARRRDTVKEYRSGPRRSYALPIAASAAVSLAVAYADFQNAAAYKRAAEWVASTYGAENSEVWFQGHWGFQHYMESHGFRPFDLGDMLDSETPDYDITLAELGLKRSDVAVIEADTYRMPANESQLIEKITIPAGRWAATMDRYVGAGFYLGTWGLLPYFFGPTPSMTFEVYRVVQPGETGEASP